MSNPIKLTIKSELFSLLLIVFTLIASVYFYFNLPERVPVHWNFAGEVDGYGSGQMQSIFFPALIIGMYLLFIFIPYLDPKKERYEQFAKVYNIFRTAILFIIAFIYFISSLAGLGYNIKIGIWVPLLIGALFMVLGNYMGKIKRNWFVGIRTPWTLSSEEVWNKTHRFGGKMFMIAGAILMLDSILPVNLRLPAFIFALALILFGAVVYSYIVYKQEKRKNESKK